MQREKKVELLHEMPLTNLTMIMHRWIRRVKQVVQRFACDPGQKSEPDPTTTDPSGRTEVAPSMVSTRNVDTSSVILDSYSVAQDAALTEWRSRPLGVCVYLYLDALEESVQTPHAVFKVAVLLAVGVTQEGKRQVLDLSVRQSEPREHWTQFLQSLADRGLCGVRLVISDKHEGLQAAVRAVLGEVPWQRCQYFLHRNAQAQVPAEEQKRSVVADIRSIFDAPDRQEADRLLKQTVEKYRMVSPPLAEWMQQNLPEGLTVFAFPQSHRRLIRTTNALERIHQEVRRRTRVTRLFPDEASCERLIAAVAMKIDQEWASDKPYILFNNE